MKQIDILLKQRPSDYVVQLKKETPIKINLTLNERRIDAYDELLCDYDDMLLCDMERHAYNSHLIFITIDKLFDKASMYGDELRPTVMRLKSERTPIHVSSNLRDKDSANVNRIYLDASVSEFSQSKSLPVESLSQHLSFTVSETSNDSLSPVGSHMRLIDSLSLTKSSVLTAMINKSILSTQVLGKIFKQVYMPLNERSINDTYVRTYDAEGRALARDYDSLTVRQSEHYFPKMSIALNIRMHTPTLLRLCENNMAIRNLLTKFLVKAILKTNADSFALESSESRMHTIISLPYREAQGSQIVLSTNISALSSIAFCVPDTTSIAVNDNIAKADLIVNTSSESNAFSLIDEVTADMEFEYGLVRLYEYDDDLLDFQDERTLEAMALHRNA